MYTSRTRLTNQVHSGMPVPLKKFCNLVLEGSYPIFLFNTILNKHTSDVCSLYLEGFLPDGYKQN